MLLGLGAAAESDLASRPSHHDDGEDHEHDDFESFHRRRAGARRPRGVRRSASERDRRSTTSCVSRAFSRCAASRCAWWCRASGDRFQHYFDRAWRPDEARAGRLVVIGGAASTGRRSPRPCAARGCRASAQGASRRRRRMPARRSTSARRRATSCFCRPPTPSSPASPRPRRRRPHGAPEPAPRQSAAARPSDVGRPVRRAGGRPRAPGGPAPARRPQLLALRRGAGRWRRAAPAASRSRSCRATISPTRSCRAGATLPAEAATGSGSTWCTAAPTTRGQFLAYAAALLGSEEPWREPAPLMRAGLYWPGLAQPDLAGGAKALAAGPRRSRLWSSTARWSRRAISRSIDALIEALGEARPERRCRSSPRASRTRSARRWSATSLQRRGPVVLNATGFAVSSPGAGAPRRWTSRAAASSRSCSPAAARRPGATARAACRRATSR